MSRSQRRVRRLAIPAGLLAAAFAMAACDFEADGATSTAPTPPSAAPSMPAAGSGVPPSPAPSLWAPTQGPSTPCSAEGISLSMGPTDGAMGLRAASIDLRNCGTKPYKLKGYPELRVLDEKKQPFNVRVHKGTQEIKDPGPKALTIAPGKSANIGIVWRNLVTESTTVAVSGSYLEVRPAPGRPVVVVTANGPLDLGNTGRMEVTAWAPAPKR